MKASIAKVKTLLSLSKRDPSTSLETQVDFSDHLTVRDVDKSLLKLGFHIDLKSLKRPNPIINFVGPAGAIIHFHTDFGIGTVKLDPKYQAVQRPPKQMIIKFSVDNWDLTEEDIIEIIANKLPKKLGIRVG